MTRKVGKPKVEKPRVERPKVRCQKYLQGRRTDLEEWRLPER
jgi:hypothetical protein